MPDQLRRGSGKITPKIFRPASPVRRRTRCRSHGRRNHREPTSLNNGSIVISAPHGGAVAEEPLRLIGAEQTVVAMSVIRHVPPEPLQESLYIDEGGVHVMVR